MNPDASAAPTAGGFEHVGDRLVHDGHVWNLVVGKFHAPDGSTFHREIVRSNGAVGVIPLRVGDDGAASVVLVRQYRGAFDEFLLEVPAGMRDVDGEAPEVTAARELIEEVGLRAGSLRFLTVFYPSVGMTDATVQLFVATDLAAVEQSLQGPEEENLTVLEVRLDDALTMIDDGRIRDAKTVIGLLALARSLERDGR